MTTKPSILFIPFHRISLVEMMPIASKLAEDGRYDPLFLLRSSAFTREDVLMVRGEGMEVSGRGSFLGLQKDGCLRFGAKKKKHKEKRGEAPVPEFSPEKKSRELKKKIKNTLRFFIPEILWETLKYFFRIMEAHLVYRRKGVAGLVVISDTLPGVEPPFIKVANKYHIPSLIVPYSLITPMGTAKIRLQRKDYRRNYSLKTVKNRLASRLFPTWVYEFEGEKMLAHPISWALASRVAEVFPDHPWSICGGDATSVAVENGFVYDLFRKQGVPEKKMVITGKPAMDIIYRASHKENRETLLRELKVPGKNGVLLLAVPQLAEHEIMSWERHWEEIEFLLSTLSELPGFSIVLSLHPRSNPSDYKKLSEKYRAIIAHQRIYELLPTADIFVATFSTTVMYAVGIGTPSVVVDFYDLGYAVYDDLPGVSIVRDRGELGTTLHSLLPGAGGRRKMAGSDPRRWILFDGKCTDRITQELYRLADKKT
jgi:hypothetical protein